MCFKKPLDMRILCVYNEDIKHGPAIIGRGKGMDMNDTRLSEATTIKYGQYYEDRKRHGQNPVRLKGSVLYGEMECN
jgi:hypothetical protein